jgi:hypothetical protein
MRGTQVCVAEAHRLARSGGTTALASMVLLIGSR